MRGVVGRGCIVQHKTMPVTCYTLSLELSRVTAIAQYCGDSLGAGAGTQLISYDGDGYNEAGSNSTCRCTRAGCRVPAVLK